MQAKPFVTISSDKYDISLVARLATRLIDENGIYRLTVGPRECQIEFIPSERSFRYEYRNENFDPSQPIIVNRNQSNLSQQSQNIKQSEHSDHQIIRSSNIRSIRSSEHLHQHSDPSNTQNNYHQ